jgi:hypothetical protein
MTINFNSFKFLKGTSIVRWLKSKETQPAACSIYFVYKMWKFTHSLGAWNPLIFICNGARKKASKPLIFAIFLISWHEIYGGETLWMNFPIWWLRFDYLTATAYFHHSNPRHDHHIPQGPQLAFFFFNIKTLSMLGHLYIQYGRHVRLHFTYQTHPSLCKSLVQISKLKP